MNAPIRQPITASDVSGAAQEVRDMLAKTWPRTPRQSSRDRPTVITPYCMQGRRWYPSEHRIIKQMAASHTAADIAEKLGRSEYSVKVRMWFLGLSVVRRKVKEPSLVDEGRAERVFANLYPSQRTIVRQISAQTGFSIPELLGRSKKTSVVLARHLMIWTMARDTRLSMAQMGARLELDHSSLIHAINREDARQGTNVRALRSRQNLGAPQ